MAYAGALRLAGGSLLALSLLLVLAAGPARAQVQVLGVTSSPATPVLLNQPVQFTGQASAAGGGVLEYRWDFGDGSPRTAWLTVNTVGYAYPRPGAYTVVLQVRHASQGLASATLPLVVRLPTGPAARASAPILVHGTRREVWVVNPDHGSVGVLDADQLVFLADIDVGEQPSALALDEGGQVWVVLEGDDRLVRIDPATRTITASLELGYGARPVSLLFDAAGWGYVAVVGTGQVWRFHAVSGQVQAVQWVGPHPQALALSADGSALYVSRLVSNGSSGTIQRIGLPAFAAGTTIELPLDTTSPDSGTAARGLPNYVAALALPENGERVWYGGKKDNILRGLFREGQALSFDSTLRSLIGQVDVAGLAELVGARIDLDDAGRVSALLPAPGSSHLFAALEANNAVVVLDPWNRTLLAEVEVGRAPRGLAFDPVTRRLFVHNLLSRSVSAFAAGAQLDNGVAPLQGLGEIASAVGEPLSPQVLRGKQVFHDATDPRMTQDGYFSCSACHLDGRGDGRVWDFSQLGEGLRNTTSLLGSAGMGRGLVHWSGNFDEIQDFEVPIRNLFGGAGFMADSDYFADGRDHPLGPAKAGFSEDLDALAAYVASLDRDDRSPQRSFDGSLTADGVAGRALFVSLSCGRCHAGPAFTDSASGLRHDVGTLSAGSGQRLGGPLLALDTPSLRGLFSSSPYLHDGSAATLDEVLVARNPDGHHGSAAGLSETLRQQLIAFLLQIDASEPAVASAATLVVSAPAAGSSVDAGQPVALAIATDLPQLVRVDYRVDGVIVATALAPPWTATWTAAGNGPVQVQADVRHDQGQFQSLSAPVALSVVLGDLVFANGFEP